MSVRIFLVGFLLLALVSCKDVLHSGLSETEANQIVSTLAQYNIAAEKKPAKDGTSEILVRPSDFSYSVKILQSFGLPREKFADINDVLGKQGLVASPSRERAQLNFAHSQELAAMIAAIPGVTSAKVQIADPERQNPFDPPPVPNVAVLALVDKDSVTPELVPQIKKLVSNSVENISQDHIGVVISQVTPPVPPGITLSEIHGVYVESGSASKAIGYVGLIGLAGLVGGLAFGLFMQTLWRLVRRKT